jgi:hypothetical protein
VAEEAEQGRATKWELPLLEYVRYSLRQNRQWFLERRETGSAEDLDTQWAGPTFRFAAFMRGYSTLADADAYTAATAVERVLVGIEPHSPDPWLEAFGQTDSVGNSVDPYDDFIVSWSKVEHPITEPSFDRAVRLSSEYPLTCPLYNGRRHAHYVYLVSVCFWLHRLSAPEPFFLSVRKAGELAGRSHMGGSRILDRALGEGLLIQVREETRQEARCFFFDEARVVVRSSEYSADDVRAPRDQHERESYG